MRSARVGLGLFMLRFMCDLHGAPTEPPYAAETRASPLPGKPVGYSENDCTRQNTFTLISNEILDFLILHRQFVFLKDIALSR